MANKKISQLSFAAPLNGSELIEVVRSGGNLCTTAQAIADLAPAEGGSPNWPNGFISYDGTIYLQNGNITSVEKLGTGHYKIHYSVITYDNTVAAFLSYAVLFGGNRTDHELTYNDGNVEVQFFQNLTTPIDTDFGILITGI